MAVLLEGQKLPIASKPDAGKSVVFVKLTDSALRSLEEYFKHRVNCPNHPHFHHQTAPHRRQIKTILSELFHNTSATLLGFNSYHLNCVRIFSTAVLTFWCCIIFLSFWLFVQKETRQISEITDCNFSFWIGLKLKLKDCSGFFQSSSKKDKKWKITEIHKKILLVADYNKSKEKVVIWRLKRIEGCVLQGCFESAPFLDSRGEAEPRKLPAVESHLKPIAISTQEQQLLLKHPSSHLSPQYSRRARSLDLKSAFSWGAEPASCSSCSPFPAVTLS